MSQFIRQNGQSARGRHSGEVAQLGVAEKPSANRILMMLRVVYAFLVIGGVVGIAFGAMQGAWLIVVTVVFWVSQESRYGILASRGR